MLGRIAVALVSAVFAAAACAGAASAATVSVEDGVLTYAAEPGEENAVDVVSDIDVEGLVYVYEYAAEVSPGPGCVPTPDPYGLPYGVYLTFNCPGVDSVSIELGDGDDYGGSYTTQPATIDGGDGADAVSGSYSDDQLRGGAGSDSMIGGPGKDAIDGGDGDDRLDGDYVEFFYDGEEESTAETKDGDADKLSGGAGDDQLRGGAGADELAGGPGIDTADYGIRQAANVVTLDGQPNDGAAGENDALGADVEAVRTGSGNDTITGDGGANVITSGAGSDTIDPGAGADRVSAGAGEDTIAVRDGAQDAVECGDGLPDRVTADGDDIAGGDCEVIDRPAGAAGAPAPVAGARISPRALTLTVAAKRGARGLLRLSGRLALPAEAGRTACAGQIVKISATVGARRITVDLPLSPRCRFSASIPSRIGARTKVRARATYAGSTTIGPATSRLVTVKAARRR